LVGAVLGWAYGSEPVIPIRRDSKVKDALRVGRKLVTQGTRRLVELFKGRWSIERLLGFGESVTVSGCFLVVF